MISIETRPEGRADFDRLARDTVVMNWEERRKSRQRLTTVGGIEIALGLPSGSTIENGDVLYSDDDLYIVVQAAREEVLCVFPGDPAEFARAAYEIGSRRLPMGISLHLLTTVYSPLLESCFKKMGIRCAKRQIPFNPIRRENGHAC